LLKAQSEPAAEYLGRLGTGLGQLHLANGDVQHAIDELEAALETLEQHSLLWLTTGCALYLARAYVSTGKPAQAQELLRKGIACSASGGDPDYAGPLLMELARLAKDTETQADLLQRALEAAATRIRYADLHQLLADSRTLLSTLEHGDGRRYAQLHALHQTVESQATNR